MQKKLRLDFYQASKSVYLIIYTREELRLLLIFFRSLTYEIHKLIEFGGDDNLSTTVTLFSQIGGVGLERIVFSSSSGSESLGVYTIIILQRLYHRRGPQTREVPVVAYILTRDGYIVSISLDKHVIVFVVLDNFSNFREGLRSTVVDFLRSALVEHVVGQ